MSDIETTDVDMFTIGNNLRELREQKRVTQMQVVDVLGVSYTHYAKIEEGMRGMSLKMLIKLIRYFETDANTILGSAAMGVARWKREEQGEEKRRNKEWQDRRISLALCFWQRTKNRLNWQKRKRIGS